MTQPSYTTNLTTLSAAESNTSWVEFTGPSDDDALDYDIHGSPQGADADWPFIQNTYAVTQTCTSTKTGLGSLGYDNAASIGGHGTDGAYLVWQLFANPNFYGYADGGLRVVIGDAVNSFYAWYVGGVDIGTGIYLGWQCHAVNTTVTPDDTDGTYAGTAEEIVGAAVYTTAGIGKGEPHAVDVIRYGRCDAIFEYGDVTNGYCIIEEFARANDANDISFTADTTNTDATLTNIAAAEVEKLYPGAPLSGTGIPATTYVKYIVSTTSVEMTNAATATGSSVSITSQPYNVWGLIQKTAGGYLWQGLMQFGTVTNAVDFRDSDRIVFIKWCPKVTTNFNTIEIVNASSRIDMTNFQFIQLDTSTASRGRWITTNDADVNLENCSFQDMGTFAFDSNTTVLSCTFTRCDEIDAQQADLSFSKVLESVATGGGADGGAALLWDVAADPNTYLNDMEFTKGAGSHHAIEFGSNAPQTINLTNMTFTDFSASDQQTTSVLYFQDTGSDVTWTVAHTGTTGTISYYKERSGDTVTISSSVPVTITVKDTDQNLISNAQVAVYLSDDTEVMNEDTVSGVASENYTGSTPANNVVVRVRKASSADSPKYKNYSSLQTIAAGTGLTLAVTLEEDPNNNATT